MKERTKHNEHVGMQKGANFTTASTTFLKTANFTKSSQSSMFVNPLFSKQLPHNKLSFEYRSHRNHM